MRCQKVPRLLLASISAYLFVTTTTSFTIQPVPTFLRTTTTACQNQQGFPLFMADESSQDEMIACKIKVSGDVNGGYYRACVMNEVGN